MRRLFILTALLFALPVHALTIEWVTVGGPDNSGELSGAGAGGTGPDAIVGGVDYVYRISKHEVTNAQYAEFLNAVAETDTYGLYNTSMGSDDGGITTSGCPGGDPYCAIAGRGDMPVNYVSFYDSLRFANWLHNGQGSGDTETGAYTITADGITNNSITRNADAIIFLTSEDEWYKAAYYDALSTSYFDFPAGSDVQTTCALSGATPNTANCDPGGPDDLTDVGSYTGSASPNETFDQGGNVWEWNEAIHSSARGLRGGSFFYGPGDLAASFRNTFGNPAGESYEIGFRVATVPEPDAWLLGVTALLVVAGLRRIRA